MNLDSNFVYHLYPFKIRNSYPYQYQFFLLTLLTLSFGFHNSLLFLFIDLGSSSWSTYNIYNVLLASFFCCWPNDLIFNKYKFLSSLTKRIKSFRLFLTGYLRHTHDLFCYFYIELNHVISISSELTTRFFWTRSIMSYI